METMVERIMHLVQQSGQAPQAISLLATDGKNRDLLRDMMRRGSPPRDVRVLERLAEALETTVGYLRTGRHDTALIADRRTGYGAEPRVGSDLPRDLPIKGTALAHDLTFGDDGIEIEAHVIELQETIGYLRRPAILAGRDDAYGIYIEGVSMAPRFEPGDAEIVETRRPPSRGDYVVVQLAEVDGDQDMRRMVLVKRLVRRTATAIELEQFNPPITFRVPREKVVAVHRVMSMKDLLG